MALCRSLLAALLMGRGAGCAGYQPFGDVTLAPQKQMAIMHLSQRGISTSL